MLGSRVGVFVIMTVRARRKLAVSYLALLPALLMISTAPATAARDTHPSSATNASTQGIAAWAIASPDLRADPAVRLGVLPNGMRYALMHNETPKGAGAIRFAFNVASLEEEDREKGVAHLGWVEIRGGCAIKKFQIESIGMTRRAG